MCDTWLGRYDKFGKFGIEVGTLIEALSLLSFYNKVVVKRLRYFSGTVSSSSNARH